MINRQNSGRYVFRLVAIGAGVIAIGVFFVAPLVAQPGSVRDFSAYERAEMTKSTQQGIDTLTRQINKDRHNVALYKRRIERYNWLLELSFDNGNRWQRHADKYEADISRVIHLEPTIENYKWRAEFLGSRLQHGTPKSIRELYPHNRYLESAVSDYLHVLLRTANPAEQAYLYTALSWIYSIRVFLLTSVPTREKWLDKLPRKIIIRDFDASLKYGRLANEDITDTTSNLLEIYTRNADSASKLRLDEPARKFKEEALNLSLRRGESWTQQGKFNLALEEYGRALEFDQNDELKKRGWLLIKRASVNLQLNKVELAEADLAAAAETKYVLNCPQFYKARFQLHQKLGKTDLAREDLQTASQFRRNENCQ